VPVDPKTGMKESPKQWEKDHDKHAAAHQVAAKDEAPKQANKKPEKQHVHQEPVQKKGHQEEPKQASADDPRENDSAAVAAMKHTLRSADIEIQKSEIKAAQIALDTKRIENYALDKQQEKNSRELGEDVQMLDPQEDHFLESLQKDGKMALYQDESKAIKDFKQVEDSARENESANDPANLELGEAARQGVKEEKRAQSATRHMAIEFNSLSKNLKKDDMEAVSEDAKQLEADAVEVERDQTDASNGEEQIENMPPMGMKDAKHLMFALTHDQALGGKGGKGY